MNTGHRPEELLSSRVNDRICDCCDGSDEWGTGISCPNTCEEMGRKEKEEQRRLKELHEQGFLKKAEYSTQGKQKEEESRAILTQKEMELEVVKSEVHDLAAAKDTAEEPERAAKEEHRKKWDEEMEAKKAATRRADAQFGFDELDTNSDSYVSVDELRTRYELDDDQDGDISQEEALGYLDNQQSVDFETFLSSVWERIADKCHFQRPTPPPVVPPPTLPSTVEEDHGAPNDREDEDYDFDDDDDDDDDDNSVPQEGDGQMPEYDNATKELIAAADAARDAHSQVESKQRNLEREIGDIRKYLEISYGVDHEFSPLYDNCYEFTDREYTYKMCAFSKVTQQPKNGGRETNLGSWGSWKGPADNIYSVMLYDNGEKCWNGPSRSATVSLVCGLEDKLLSASEPNRCEYAMEFSTPAACVHSKHPTHEEL